MESHQHLLCQQRYIEVISLTHNIRLHEMALVRVDGILEYVVSCIPT